MYQKEEIEFVFWIKIPGISSDKIGKTFAVKNVHMHLGETKIKLENDCWISEKYFHHIVLQARQGSVCLVAHFMGWSILHVSRTTFIFVWNSICTLFFNSIFLEWFYWQKNSENLITWTTPSIFVFWGSHKKQNAVLLRDVLIY